MFCKIIIFFISSGSLLSETTIDCKCLHCRSWKMICARLRSWGRKDQRYLKYISLLIFADNTSIPELNKFITLKNLKLNCISSDT